MTSSLIKCLDDTDFPVNISAAISLQPYITMEKCEPIIRSNLEHIIQRFVLILQRVAVESVMQTFDTLINHFSEEVMQMSIQIIQVLRHVHRHVHAGLREQRRHECLSGGRHVRLRRAGRSPGGDGAIGVVK